MRARSSYQGRSASPAAFIAEDPQLVREERGTRRGDGAAQRAHAVRWLRDLSLAAADLWQRPRDGITIGG